MPLLDTLSGSEALSIEIDLNLPAQRVVSVLDRIAANRGYPVMLRMDTRDHHPAAHRFVSQVQT